MINNLSMSKFFFYQNALLIKKIKEDRALFEKFKNKKI